MRTSVDSHYYVSLCLRALKRLGLAGSESTSEDESIAEQIVEIGENFRFAPPMAGWPVFTVVYQIPGYLDPEQAEQMVRIFQSVKDFIESGDSERISGRFPDGTAEWDKWFTGPWPDLLLRPLGERKREVCRLLDLFCRYLEDLWPAYHGEFAGWRDEFAFDGWESELRMSQVVNAWEKVVQASYPYRGFTLVVCPETPSLASSLGPDQIVFGARHGLELARLSLVRGCPDFTGLPSTLQRLS